MIHGRRSFAKICVLGPRCLPLAFQHFQGVLPGGLGRLTRWCPWVAWECVLWGSQQARRLAVSTSAVGALMVRFFGLLKGARTGLRPRLAAGLH